VGVYRRGASSGGSSPPDEVTSHPVVTPEALVDPVTYDLTSIGVRVKLGRPRIAKETFIKDGWSHYWFPVMTGFPGGQRLILTSLLGADSSENAVDVVERNLSIDGGRTWIDQLTCDDIGFTPNEVADPSDGCIYTFGNRWKPYPTNQVRNFTCDRGRIAYTTDGKLKITNYPHGAYFGGLPFDVAAFPLHPALPSSINGYPPRRVWSYFVGDCRPLICSDGTWFISAYVLRPGQERTTPVVYASTDKGKTWAFRSVPSTVMDTGDNEATMIQLASGKILWAARRDDGSSVWIYAISADMGYTWTSVIGPRTRAVEHGGVGGGASVGWVAPTMVRLGNGMIFCVAGRQNPATVMIGMGVCKDGGEGGLGMGGASEWQRLDFVAHHNLFAGSGTDLTPGVIRQLTDPLEERSMCYLDAVAQSSNRAIFVYDHTPFFRSPCRQGSAANNGKPTQLMVVEAEFTSL
jgi:hypothetical protein